MLKSIIKKIIYQFYAKSNQQILPVLDKKSTVSFDVFDTLLKRDVENPDTLFEFMENELEKNGKLCVKGFSDLRKKAERKAKETYPDREITLTDIYSCLPISDNDRQELMDMECELEVKLSTPNIPIQNLYKVCLEQRKRILFLSDIYLPSDVVTKILEKNGYTEGTLYVSSESGLTKRSGGLFVLVREKEKIDIRQWVHIGDHILSDYLIPKKLGFKSCLIAREPKYNPYVDKKIYRRNVEYRQLNHFIDTRISRYNDPYQQVGYAVLGPLLYGFSKWLDFEIPSDETIAFLAREGELLQKAFQIVSKRPSLYLYISRRVALISRIVTAQSPKDISQFRKPTIHLMHTQRELAHYYGLSDEEIRTVFQKNHLDENSVIKDAVMENKVMSVIWERVKAIGGEQHGLLQKYLEQLV